ncbi:MAG: helix-turn-helix domain-containing protein [Thermoplasmatales archaeon]|nr:MAG: helix-turn-helix domain-containing protein [Thermoplasmatales archaeon]
MKRGKTFGDFFKEKRRASGQTLREFCRKNPFDAGNISKIERNILPPPQSHKKIESYAKALGIEKGSDDWYEFFDLASTWAGKIPPDIVSNSELMNALPILFRSIRRKDVDEEGLDNLIDSIRKELR